MSLFYLGNVLEPFDANYCGSVLYWKNMLLKQNTVFHFCTQPILECLALGRNVTTLSEVTILYFPKTEALTIS